MNRRNRKFENLSFTLLQLDLLLLTFCIVFPQTAPIVRAENLTNNKLSFNYWSNRSNVQTQKEVSRIPWKRDELQDSPRTLGFFSPNIKSFSYHYNYFLFISKLNYNSSFGSRPSEVILRKLSFGTFILLLRYASDYPPAPYSSISFGTLRIILRRLTLWPMKTCYVGKFNFPHPRWLYCLICLHDHCNCFF